jgi:APA family basic amino acid/polyamine antiporter
VFLSAGFMAQDLGPRDILLAWFVGAVMALSGVRSYGQVVRWSAASGGEYRFLTDLLHPAAGYLAGWSSLLVGFSAPIAINAVAAAAFAKTLIPGLPVAVTAVGAVAALTAFHTRGLRTSKRVQNGLVTVDALLLGGFVAVGFAFGSSEWPTWMPPSATPGFAWGPFAQSLLYVSFAYSGWNAAVYAASEFRHPARDVPRAMAIGCSIVAVLYLAVNWVFVANLDPIAARAVFDYESTRVTLGHVLVTELVGRAGASFMSLLAMTALLAGASAMLVVGPRVYSAMAADGYLPAFLQSGPGAPPRAAIVLQGVLSGFLVFAQTAQQALASVGAVLIAFAALVSLGVLRATFSGRRTTDRWTLVCAFAHLGASLGALGLAWRASGGTPFAAFGVAAIVALFFYARTARSIRAPGA